MRSNPASRNDGATIIATCSDGSSLPESTREAQQKGEGGQALARGRAHGDSDIRQIFSNRK